MIKEICVGDIVQKHVAPAARDRPSIGTPVGNNGPSIAMTEFGVRVRSKSARMKPGGMLAWSSPGFGNPKALSHDFLDSSCALARVTAES